MASGVEYLATSHVWTEMGTFQQDTGFTEFFLNAVSILLAADWLHLLPTSLAAVVRPSPTISISSVRILSRSVCGETLEQTLTIFSWPLHTYLEQPWKHVSRLSPDYKQAGVQFP